MVTQYHKYIFEHHSIANSRWLGLCCCNSLFYSRKFHLFKKLTSSVYKPFLTKQYDCSPPLTADKMLVIFLTRNIVTFLVYIENQNFTRIHIEKGILQVLLLVQHRNKPFLTKQYDCSPPLTADKMLVIFINNSDVEQVEAPAIYLIWLKLICELTLLSMI
jgi:hypothetical protein